MGPSERSTTTTRRNFLTSCGNWKWHLLLWQLDPSEAGLTFFAGKAHPQQRSLTWSWRGLGMEKTSRLLHPILKHTASLRFFPLLLWKSDFSSPYIHQHPPASVGKARWRLASLTARETMLLKLPPSRSPEPVWTCCWRQTVTPCTSPKTIKLMQ